MLAAVATPQVAPPVVAAAFPIFGAFAARARAHGTGVVRAGIVSVRHWWTVCSTAMILTAMTFIALPDGRLLDIRVTGPEDGTPFVVHHGTPAGVGAFRAVEEGVHRRGLRLVTYSRAGYGGSTRNPGRTVADVVPDLETLLDHLGAERCVTLGWSGGGPHALASAALAPGRVAGATLLACVAPYGLPDLEFLAGMGQDNIDEFGAALEGEAVLAPMLDEAAAKMRVGGTAGTIDELSSLLPEVDLAAAKGEIGEDLVASIAEGVRESAAGWVDDDLAFIAPWGFDLAEVSVPTFLWQGDLDLMVPFAHGRWLAEHIPGVAAHLHAGEGHISVWANRIDEVLDELTAVLR
jgi:pimeloyl-ACP methyl ester carboxylesterase